MTKKLLALYGLKWNPFAAEVPPDALLTTPKIEAFCWRIEQSHVREGGFALITGEPGTGKSVVLSVVLAGDGRLTDLFRREDLRPLGSRIRTRLSLDYATREELRACLEHLVAAAGNATLMTAELMTTLCEHALGNYRVLTTMAGELLAVAAQRELAQLDEKLYLEVFAPPRSAAPAK